MNFFKSFMIVFFCVLNYANITCPSQLFENMTGRMIEFLVEKEINRISDFYQATCICPENVDPEMFKILVKMAMKDCGENQKVSIVTDAYKEDKDQKIVSNFGLSVQARALELLKEPIAIGKKLPIPSTNRFQVSKFTNLMNEKFSDNKKFIYPGFMAMAYLISEKQTNKFKDFLKSKNVTSSRFVIECYSKICYWLCIIDKDLAAKELMSDKDLAPYLSVIQYFINNGDFCSYSTIKTQEECDVFELSMQRKIQSLYSLEKIKYMLDDVVHKRELIENEAQVELDANLTMHGILLPATVKNLNCNSSDGSKRIERAFDQGFIEMQKGFVAGLVDISLAPEIEKERSKIVNDFVAELDQLALQKVEDAWKVGGKELVGMQSESRKDLKNDEREGFASAIQKKAARIQNKIAGSLLLGYKKVIQNELDGYTKNLKAVGQEKKKKFRVFCSCKMKTSNEV